MLVAAGETRRERERARDDGQSPSKKIKCGKDE